MPRFFAEVISALVGAQDLDAASVGLPELAGESLTVSAVAYAAMLERASLERANPALGLELAEHVTAANLDVFGALVVASRTIREALADIGAIQVALLGRVLWTMQEQDEHAFLAPSYMTNAVMTDFTLGIAYRCAQHALSPPDRGSIRVYLTRVPSDVAPYRAVFGDSIDFCAPRIGLSIPRHALDRARPGTDPSLARTLREHAFERIAAREESWVARVRDALRVQPQLTHVSFDAIGARWNLSARGLRRRVEAEGSKLSDILNMVRYERARRALDRGRVPLAKIAETLGYSDVSAFHRAFKRWAGVGPGSYRARNR